MYPRPYLKRDSYYSLNGMWIVNGEEKYVPSWINQSHIHYEKVFDYKKNNDRTIIHFGSIDQIADVYLNDIYLGKHYGGYLPFEYEVSDIIKEKNNKLVVDVIDELDITYPYGKQTKNPKGMWYTAVSGIWKEVWLEDVPGRYIKNIKINTDLKGADLDICIDDNGKEEYRKERIDVDNPILWTNDNPHLYYQDIIEGNDKVQIYFGLRTIEIKKINGINRVLLNNKPIFINGVLDQGYFKKQVFIAEKDDYLKDIKRMKELGFNLIRKHIKIEDEEFYYLCDKEGMLVMQDMVQNGPYNFIRDTALPNIGYHKNDKVKKLNKAQEFFIQHSKDTIMHLHNHPSIIAYTIFNEGWGQFNCDDMYKELKSLDTSRLYDATSGWFKGELSDFDSLHIYFGTRDIKVKERPLLISECGGYVYNADNQKVSWGYGIAKSKDELTDKIIDLYSKMIIPNIKKGLCGVIYTQLSDVEGEINGLYTYDRLICKVDKERLNKFFKENIKDDLLV